jgi:phosphoserine phosphatase
VGPVPGARRRGRRAGYQRRNEEFFAQYQAGVLDPVEYLEFALGTLAGFPRTELEALHAQYMREVIEPAIRPQALDLVRRHQDAGDLVAIITATNGYSPRRSPAASASNTISRRCRKFDAAANPTGKLAGTPTSGSGQGRAHARLAGAWGGRLPASTQPFLQRFAQRHSAAVVVSAPGRDQPERRARQPRTRPRLAFTPSLQ